MRLAQRTEFAGTSDVLLIRHERHGPQLSRNPDFLARDAAILAGKWRDAFTAACGRRAYRRWQLRLVLWTERCHWSARWSAAAGCASRRRARPDGCSGSSRARRHTWPRRSA